MKSTGTDTFFHIIGKSTSKLWANIYLALLSAPLQDGKTVKREKLRSQEIPYYTGFTVIIFPYHK